MSHGEPTGAAAGASLKEKLHEEIVKYLAVSAYLFVCFAVLQWYKAALLQDAGVHYLPLGVALVKALVIGKFLLIGDAVQARLEVRPGRLLGRIARRVAWLLVILALLTFAEELIVGWFHGQSLVETQAELRARTLLERVSELSLMGLILLPLVATAELNHALGPDVLRNLLLRPASTAPAPLATGLPDLPLEAVDKPERQNESALLRRPGADRQGRHDND